MSEVMQLELVVRHIDISKIQPNPHQPRARFDEEALQELAGSIQEKGVLQPVTVRDISKDGAEAYELIAGERRCRACELISRSTIPAIVLDVSDDEAVEMAFIENLQREDLTVMEEARGLAGLCERYGGNKSKVVEKIGKSPIYINDRLSLLELPEPVQKMVDDGRINVAQAKVLLDINDTAKQLQWAEMAHRLNLNANELKGRTQHLAGKKGKSSQSDARERKVTFPGLTGGMIRLYEDLQALEPAKFTAEQRNTLLQQAGVLVQGLESVRKRLAEKGG